MALLLTTGLQAQSEGSRMERATAATAAQADILAKKGFDTVYERYAEAVNIKDIDSQKILKADLLKNMENVLSALGKENIALTTAMRKFEAASEPKESLAFAKRFAENL